MVDKIPLDKMIFDAKGSKYKLVLEAAQKSKEIKQRQKDSNSGEKLVILALREVLENRYNEEQKEKEKSVEKVSSKKKKK